MFDFWFYDSVTGPWDMFLSVKYKKNVCFKTYRWVTKKNILLIYFFAES